MIARYNRLSFAFGIPGLILQGLGYMATNDKKMGIEEGAAVAITLVGTIILMVGFALYAKSRGRSPVWCVMGLLSIVGLIVLGVLKDLTLPEEKKTS